MAITTIYENTNEIMRILGQQQICGLLNDDFDAVLDAHKVYNGISIESIGALFDIAIDFYSLGVVTGKRLERAEKSHREYTPIVNAR